MPFMESHGLQCRGGRFSSSLPGMGFPRTWPGGCEERRNLPFKMATSAVLGPHEDLDLRRHVLASAATSSGVIRQPARLCPRCQVSATQGAVGIRGEHQGGALRSCRQDEDEQQLQPTLARTKGRSLPSQMRRQPMSSLCDIPKFLESLMMMHQRKMCTTGNLKQSQNFEQSVNQLHSLMMMHQRKMCTTGNLKRRQSGPTI